jgi:hypothetical protein
MAGRQRKEISRLSAASRLALVPIQRSSQWVPVALSLGVKRPGRKADNKPLIRSAYRDPDDGGFYSVYTTSLS